MKHAEQKPTDGTSVQHQKKPYKSPKLTDYGTVEQQTRTGTMMGGDGSTSS